MTPHITTKVIRTDDQHHAYLEEVEALMQRGEHLSSADKERLELLTVLIEEYEIRKHPIEPLDPIEAILFRMEEKGLKQADLIPYFGTSSRVSEVLKRKRPLTVQMIRAVSIGLGISAETLVGLGEVRPEGAKEIDWSKFPIKEMAARGWLEAIAVKNAPKLKAPFRHIFRKQTCSMGSLRSGAPCPGRLSLDYPIRALCLAGSRNPNSSATEERAWQIRSLQVVDIFSQATGTAELV
ncbi:MAG: hypothetical protein WDM84_05500 [Bauldia sp.]